MNVDYPAIQQFRIWNPERKQFMFSGGTPMMLSSFFEQTATCHTVHRMPYQRDTGLVDWKGVPVFEGDRVMGTYREDDEELSSPGIVEWYANQAMFVVKLGDPEGDNESWGMIKFSVLQVFAHIYDFGDAST